MELEQRRPPEMAKKLWHIMRIVFLMMRKGISKSNKFKMDVSLLLQRGNQLAEKAMEDLITFHNNHTNLASALTCRPDDSYLSSFISPREYEFSCSNSPAFSFRRYRGKQRSQNYCYRRHHRRGHGGYGDGDRMQRVLAVQQEMFCDERAVESDWVTASPMSLLGFGRSPAGVRQLRVTDSPFSLRDGGEEQEKAAQMINKQAEEFINEFHRDLYRQKAAYCLESPYCYNNSWASWLG